jgi:hypothetical protein
MNRLGVFSLILMCASARSLAWTEPPGAGRTEVPRLGMSQRELKLAFGPPSHVSRLILFRRHLEQWQLAEPPRWVEFNAIRGEEPVVIQFSDDKKQ